MKRVVDDKPFVSIIVPTYNGADTIADCISALLNLQYPEDRREIIIVDNNSFDNTLEITKKFPVHFLEECDVQSSYAARNKGVRHAKGEILAFTDSDCVPDKAWLLQGVECFSDELVGAVAGRIIGAKPITLVEEFLQSSNYLGEEVCLMHPFLPYIQTANAFYRRVVLDKIGPFNQTLVSGGDADLTWRMQLQTGYKLKHNEKAVVAHRHRATVRKYYKQMYNHGVGKADLENIYSQEMRKKGLRVESSMPLIIMLARISGAFLLHLLRSVVSLLKFQWKTAVFEMIDWYGKVGKRLGVRHRIKQ